MSGDTDPAEYSYNEIVIGADAIGHGPAIATIGDDLITDLYAGEDGQADLHSGTVVLSAETVPEPVNNMMYFLNENNADPDTIAVFNGTTWKYFISQ